MSLEARWSTHHLETVLWGLKHGEVDSAEGTLRTVITPFDLDAEDLAQAIAQDGFFVVQLGHHSEN